MLNYLKNFASEVTTNPEKTNRAVIASILIVGMVALTLNLGETLAPQYFAGQVTDSDTIRIVETPTTQNLTAADEKTAEEISTAVQTCKSNRANNRAKAFLGSFEKSFNGILPGAGDLLREHAGMVSSRRDALVLEVMQRYANLQFCIDNSAFKRIYYTGYASMLGNDLNVYMKVVSAEEPSGENNSGRFLTNAMSDSKTAADDLTQTENSVKLTIDNAVEAAKAADQQTTATIASLSTQTSNNLADRSMTLAQNDKAIANNQTQVQGQQSQQLDKIIQLLAYQNAGPIPESKKAFFGGSDAPDVLKWRDAPDGDSSDYFEQPNDITPDEGETVEIALPESAGLKDVLDQAKTEITASADGSLFSYGILNLVDDFNKMNFLALNFKKAVLLYLAAQNNFDPYAPRSGFAKGAEELPYPNDALIQNQLCNSIDKAGAKCFSF
ncbi:MAG: hypothetical protein PHO48_02895 [Candidatus Gracilibacteria bacterium]|nr:hypothetical protein [Candidatus Gracilibacteria bacterium]MDD5179060.1 hypothetical protein [Candidatus Gracilibacteria bacterium]